MPESNNNAAATIARPNTVPPYQPEGLGRVYNISRSKLNKQTLYFIDPIGIDRKNPIGRIVFNVEDNTKVPTTPSEILMWGEDHMYTMWDEKDESRPKFVDNLLAVVENYERRQSPVRWLGFGIGRLLSQKSHG